jgi:hypothetical protein
LRESCLIEAAYNRFVARGWESKAVEQQQEEAENARQRSKPLLTADQLARQREKQGLRLSRQRILQQLESAQNPNHRRMLESALADLDAKLARMG